jgi:hypothetical protein
VLRFRHRGRLQEFTLDRYPDLSLAAARISASKKRVAIIDGVNPADEVRKVKTQKDWAVRQFINDYRDKAINTLAGSTQRSYGRNLTRVENEMGCVPVQLMRPADVVAELEHHKIGWAEAFTLWCVLRGIIRHAAGKKVIIASPCTCIFIRGDPRETARGAQATDVDRRGDRRVDE